MDTYEQIMTWIATNITITNKTLENINCDDNLNIINDYLCYSATVSLMYNVLNNQTIKTYHNFIANKNDKFNYVSCVNYLEQFPNNGTTSHGYYNPYNSNETSFFIGYYPITICNITGFIIIMFIMFICNLINYTKIMSKHKESMKNENDIKENLL